MGFLGFGRAPSSVIRGWHHADTPFALHSVFTSFSLWHTSVLLYQPLRQGLLVHSVPAKLT